MPYSKKSAWSRWLSNLGIAPCVRTRRVAKRTGYRPQFWVLEDRTVPSGAALIAINDPSITEGDAGSANLNFTVSRSGDTTTNVTVSFNTSDLSPAAGAATAGSDYTATSGTVTIASGSTTATVSVPVLGDTAVEGNESFFVNLTGIANVTGPAVSFAAKQDFITGSGPRTVALEDMNGDGKRDLAIANQNAGTVSLLLNTTAPGDATPSFASKQDFTAGSVTLSMSLGDLNGDGKPDLAVANLFADTVSVFLNTTTPGAATFSFAARQDFPAGSLPSSVALGDFNGDGLQDLAVAHRDAAIVSVLLNTSAPGGATANFAARQDFTTSTGSLSLAISDVNGDGKRDLAVANSFLSSNTVSVLLNTTTPGATMTSFAAKQDFATGTTPVAVSFGDLNGDGKSDLAVANFNANTVSVLLNTTAPGAATPSFAAKQDFGTGNGPFSMSLADLNSDGESDLVVANNNAATVSVLLNTTAPGAAAPSFAAKQDFITGAGPFFTAPGDVNGDGKPDLTVANFSSATVSVLLNTTASPSTTLALAAKQDFTASAKPLSVSFGDVNGDGKPDLTVANRDTNTVSVMLNTTAPGAATPSYAAKQDFGTGLAPLATSLRDLNGDGKPDLVIANFNSSNVSVLVNTTSPGAAVVSFAPKQDFLIGGAPRSVALADFNGDGRPDLAVVDLSNNRVAVRLNTTTPGSSTISFAATQSFTTGVNPRSVALGDFNGDGKPDMAVATYSSSTVSVLLNTTTPGAAAASFAARQDFATGAGPRSVALGDFNGDGRPDLAVANYNGNTVSVLLNTTAPGATSPSFAAKQDFTTGTRPYSVAVGDVNGDGKPDLAVANYSSSNASVLLNTTAPGASTPGFAAKQDFGTGGGPMFVALADVNGDGSLDLATANFQPNTISVLLNPAAKITDNQGTGTIIENDSANTPPTITSNGGGATAAISIAENSTAVTTVAATDPNAGQTLTFSISGGADAAKFSIISTTGALRFVTAPDFENPTDVGTNNVYDVTVQVSDGAGGSDTQAMSVTVTALNDNNPAFTSSAAPSVPENTTFVLTVVATDADRPIQTVTYSITGGADQAKFTITSGGALSFVAAPDYESPTDVGTNNVYNVTVAANDGNGGTTAQNIAVTVTPVNEAPVANDDFYSVNEDAVLVIAAPGVLANDTDPDGIAAGTGTFALVTNQFSNTVTWINVSGVPAIVGTVAGFNQPQDVAITPNGQRALVTNVNSGTVTVLDLTGSLPAVIATVTVGSVPTGIAISPDGAKAIAANAGARTFSVLDLTGAVPVVTATVTLPSDVSGNPRDAAFTADSRYALIATSGTLVLVYDMSAPTPVEISSNRITAGNFPIALGTNPAHTKVIANSIGSNSATVIDVSAPPFAATGTVTVGNNPGSKPDISKNALAVVPNSDSGTVTIINVAATPTVVTTLAVGAGPRGAGIIDRSNIALIANRDGNSISRLDLGSMTFLSTITGVASANKIAIREERGDILSVSLVSGPANGTVTLNANGAFTYTPAANFNGADSFTYSVSDGNGGSDTATVNVTVSPVNDAPSFTKGANQAVAEDAGPQTVTGWATNIAAGSANESGQMLQFLVSATNPTLFASLPAIAANGTLTYTTAADANGTATITIRLMDNGGTANGGQDTSAAQTFTITVTAVNDQPVAQSDSATTNEDAAVNINVLANDSPAPATATDEAAQTLAIVAVTQPLHGVAVIHDNGTPGNLSDDFIVYTPAANYNGPDSFTYTVRDSGSPPEEANASGAVLINPVNDRPTADSATVTTPEDSAAITIDLRSLVSDVETADADLVYTLVTSPSSGTLAATATSGVYTYAPAADFHGTVSFTYQVADTGDPAGSGNSLLTSDVATITIVVTPVNDAPSAADDAYSTNEDQLLSVAAPGVLLNDGDIDGDLLTAILVSGPSQGSLSLQSDGSFVYSPGANFNGADSFTYKNYDGTADSNVATVNITITAVNDAPAAQDGTLTTAEDTAATGALVATDIDSASLTYSIVTGAAHGTVTITNSSTGAYSYTPAADYNGLDSFTFLANDGTADSNDATVSITVTAVNDAPTAQGGTLTTAEDTAANGTLVATDIDSGSLTYSVVTGAAHGTVTITNVGTGAYSYTPAADYNGPDSFTFLANDGTADSNVATVNITITAVNDAPAAQDGTLTTAEDTAATGTLVATDIDSASLSYSIVTGAAHGTVTITNAGTGAYSYTPAADYNGSDSFTFLASDGTDDSNVATVNITVTSVNDAPLAAGDAFATTENTALTVAAPGVLANDTDVDGDILAAVLQSSPSHGMVTLNADGSFTYAPAANFFGIDSFTYRAEDGLGGSSSATVTITVNPGTGVHLQDDPCAPGETALFVFGTAENDHIVIRPVGNTGEVEILLNGNSQGSFTPTSRVVVFGKAGNDNIQTAGAIALPTWLYGEAGNDRLKGGNGHDVLLGGAGDDLLVGGDGRDLLIGGFGEDRIVGNASDDILIAGATDFDDQVEALCHIMSEWSRADASFQERVDHLQNGGAGTHNDGTLLTGATVHDDGMADVLTGSSGQDWFLFNADGDGGVEDRVTDMSTFESMFQEDLDFINGD